MEKPAETAYSIHELLRRRWSPRAFSERPVEPEQLRSLFDREGALLFGGECFDRDGGILKL